MNSSKFDYFLTSFPSFHGNESLLIKTVKSCWLFSYVAQDFHYFDEIFLTEN